MTKQRRHQMYQVVHMARKALAHGDCKKASFWVNRTVSRPKTYRRLRASLDRCWVMWKPRGRR